MIKRYRKKPVEIYAIQFKAMDIGTNAHEILDWANVGDEINVLRQIDHLTVYTENGPVRADYGDWIVKSPLGDFYPCTDSVFHEVHEDIPYEDI